jgi:hypothetical protein
MKTEVLFGKQTAISRTKTSLPVQFWKKCGLLVGDVLDYGCGKDVHPYAKFDPYHLPQYDLLLSCWDTVMCNYVLCVQPDDAHIFDVLLVVRGLLREDGRALFAVRNDLHQDHSSPRGVQRYKPREEWQGMVQMIFPNTRSEKCNDFHAFVAEI